MHGALYKYWVFNTHGPVGLTLVQTNVQIYGTCQN